MSISERAADEATVASAPDAAGQRLQACLDRYGHWLLPLATALTSFILCGRLIGLGLNRAGDDLYHLFNEFALAHAASAGDDIFGPLGMEFGQPVLRFYQPLFYLNNLGWHLLTGVDLAVVHTLTIVVGLSLSPFAFCYFLLKLGLPRFAAGIGSALTLISVAGFGNSFEAYFRAGIVTQSMGGLFLPWFFGSFVGLLRGENRSASTALLFALAFLSHAIVSVFAVFGAALYLLVGGVDLRPCWRPLLAFVALGGALVLFWAAPFVAHTMTMRPVPDAVVRGGGRVWFTSVSRDELVRAVVTGRLLDDPPVVHREQVDPLDKLMDRVNVLGTVYVRPPVFTVLAGLGVLVALGRFAHAGYRFLLAGFAFSLMLFAGPDDFPWLSHLPFMRQIQTFRCTYWIEVFAFGLAGGGVEAVLARLLQFVRRRDGLLRTGLLGAYAVLVCAGLAGIGSEMVRCARAHVDARDLSRFDPMIDALSRLPNRGWPFRVDVEFKDQRKGRQAWSIVNGYQASCTHWKGTGPTAALYLCNQLAESHANVNLFSLAGVRYVIGAPPQVAPIVDARDGAGERVWRALGDGRDRSGNPTGGIHLLDSRRESFLQGLGGRPLPVVCSDAQWVWLTRGWTIRYKDRLREKATPLPLRVPAGTLASSGLLQSAEAVLYLDDRRLAADETALAAFAARGGRIVSGAPLGRLPVTVSGAMKTVWERLPALAVPPAEFLASPLRRAELEPDPRRSYQSYRFDVEAAGDLVAILPVQAVSGWQATLDGAPVAVFASGPDFVGTVVPAGAHRLVFTWTMPGWHRACLVVSLLAIVCVLVVGVRRVTQGGLG